ncbi:MAG: toll/interleukin-1 receptor domain-containing protein [Acidobacteriota bacterium]|mgnify:CR=1 FL=1
MATQAPRTKVFISYSHKDRDCLERLQVFLKSLGREAAVEWWDDTMIRPGQKWRDQIRRALRTAKVAVLLVSQDFLSSDFITTDELPSLLAAAENEGVVILPVIIKPCRFKQTKSLSQFQAVNDPSKPLKKMSKVRQEDLWVKVTDEIEKALSRPVAPPAGAGELPAASRPSRPRRRPPPRTTFIK